MIYIASPFSHKDPAVEAMRFTAVSRYTHKLLLAGEIAFSPIVYGYHFHVTYEVPGDAETWKLFNRVMLARADRMHIYMLPGWQASAGVSLERNWAAALNLPIHYIEAQL